MKRAFILLLCLGFCGCATTNVYKSEYGTKNLTTENVNKIQRNKTTQMEILALFGEPMMKTQSTAVGTMWTYSHAVSKTIDHLGFPIRMPETESRTYTLAVKFSDNGVVTDYTYLEMNPLMQGTFVKEQ